MKAGRGTVALVVGATAATGCGSGGQVALETFEDSASYAIGLNMGQSIQEIRDEIDLEVLAAGLTDAAEGRDLALTQAEIMTVLQALMTRLQESRADEMAAQEAGVAEQIAANRERGDAYRRENGSREGVTTTASGLQYEVLEPGSGPIPSLTDQVRVHYRGSLVDGQEFESSYDGEPVVFPVNQVIAGWTEALQLMSVGAKYRIVVAPELAYGNQGGPGGPNSTLIFEVELLEIL